MAFKKAVNVQEVTSTTGTNSFVLDGADNVNGFVMQAFSGFMEDGDTAPYICREVNGSDFENGLCTYIASSNTLQRTLVYESSNNNALVDFGSGPKIVACGFSASQALTEDEIYDLIDEAVTAAAVSVVVEAGLENVDNTADIDKPTSTLQQASISAAISAAIAALNKASVGLSNVDNTADIDKPTSEPQAADIVAAIDTIKAGVPTDGDNLNKLNDKILSILFKLYSINPTISSDFENQEYKLYEVPSGLSTKALTDIWTVTRGSSATITDACGLDRTVSANVPRITYDILGRASLLVEEARTNLITKPFQLFALVGTEVRPYSSDVNGRLCDVAIVSTTTGEHYPLDYAFTPTIGVTYTFSAVVKRLVGAGRILMRVAAGNYGSRQFNFDNPTSYTLTTPTGILQSAYYEDWGDGVYRLFLVWTASAASNTVCRTQLLDSSGTSSYTGNGTDAYAIPNRQLETGASGTSIIPDGTIFNRRASPKYVPDATGALVQVLTDVKAMAYNPANLNAEPVALYEVASTNLLANRDTMATETVTVVNGQTYTLSFDGAGSVQLSGANATNVIGLGAGLANQKSFTFVASSTSLTLTVTGSCLRGQLENLPYATSRIPNAMVSGVRAADVTTGVQATRAADKLLRILGKEFNAKKASFLIEANISNGSGNFATILELSDGTNSNLITVRKGVSAFFVQVTKNGVLSSVVQGGAFDVLNTALISISETVIELVINGILIASIANTAGFPRLTHLSLGYSHAFNGRHSNALVNEILYFPKNLSTAEAILITA